MTHASKIMLCAAMGILAMAAVAAVLFAQFVDRYSYQEKRASIEQLRRATQALVELQNEQLAERLLRQIIKRSVENKSLQNESEFLAVGLFSQSAQGLAASTSLQPVWLYSSKATLTGEWIQNEILTVQTEIMSARDGGVVWARVKGPDHQLYFLLATSVEVKTTTEEKKQFAIGVLPLSIFSSVNLITKGEKDALYVVDGQGYAFSYPDQQYVGAKLSSHPVVAALVRSELSEHFAVTSKQKIIGGYDRVNKSNLYVVTAAQTNITMHMTLLLLMQIAFVGVAIMVITAALLYYYISQEKNKIEILEDNLALVRQPAGVEKNLIYQGDGQIKDFAIGVVKYLRKPLGTIIGLLHLLEAKNFENEKSRSDICSKILRESRRASEFTELMAKAICYGEEKREIIELTPVLDQVISIYSGELQQAKIQIEANYSSAGRIRCNFDELKKSFKTIFCFTLQLLSQGKGADKKIIVHHLRTGGYVEITIEAVGAELKSDIRRRLFLPFQSFMQTTQLMGLELALARNYFSDLNGELSVESLGYEGFRFTARVPAIDSVARAREVELTV